MSIQNVVVLTLEDQTLDDACKKIQQIPKVRFVESSCMHHQEDSTNPKGEICRGA